MNDTASFINKLNYEFTLITSIILCAAGFIGNTITFLIMMTPEMRKISLFRYIMVSMINDCLVLASMWFFTLPDIFRFSSNSCKWTSYSCMLVFKYSGWIVVLSLIDRLLSVKYPTMFKFRNELKFQAFILLTVLILIALLTIPNYTYYDMQHGSSNKTSCTTANPQIQFYLTIFDSLIAIIIPFFVMTIITIMIGHSLIKKRKSLAITKEFKKEIRLVKLMFSMSASFLLFNLPFYIQQLIHDILSFEDSSLFVSNYIFSFSFNITNQLSYVYNSFGFFVCLFSNKVFRNYFYSKFRFLKI